jgi:hypothetical protein
MYTLSFHRYSQGLKKSMMYIKIEKVVVYCGGFDYCQLTAYFMSCPEISFQAIDTKNGKTRSVPHSVCEI